MAGDNDLRLRITIILSLCLALVLSCVVLGEERVEDSATDRKLIEADYIAQFLLRQRALAKPKKQPARKATGPKVKLPGLDGGILPDGVDVRDLDGDLEPDDDIDLVLDEPVKKKPAPPPPPKIAKHEEAYAEWAPFLPEFRNAKLDPEPLREFSLACAERGLAQGVLLTKAGVNATEAIQRIEAARTGISKFEKTTPVKTVLAAYLDLRWAIRALVLKHPSWDVKKIIFYTRRDGMIFPDVSSIHQPWVGSPGGDINILTVDTTGTGFGGVEPSLRGRLDPGHVRGLDLHFGADRLVFAWTHGDIDFSQKRCRPGHDAFVKMGSGWIYELSLSDRALRQITSGKRVHDASPTYLTDGRVAFMSNRSRSSVQCNQSQHEMFANIYACNMDGSHLERLNNSITGDYNPRLLDDGRIGYLRWEYNERSFNNPHAFWAMRPDGSYAEPVYGQHLGKPIMHTNARRIPGSHKFMIIVSQHYNLERGNIEVLDPAFGSRDPAAIRPLLPWGERPGGGMPTISNTGWFADPWPLAEDLALCAYDYSRDQYESTGFGLYLVDGSGNQELIFRDPKFSSHQPVPLRKRRKPPAITRFSKMPPSDSPRLSPVGYRRASGHGTCVVSDMYDGLEGLKEEHKPRYLRISENLPLPYFEKEGECNYYQVDGANWTPKRIIGVVPLEPDGSAHFTVPPDRALYFQLLDAEWREIRRMRSWVSLKSGELRSCSGCHEGRTTAPRLQPHPLAAKRPPRKPRPRVSWGDKPVSFVRDIRPIINKHCLRCHSGLKPPKNLDLTHRGYHALQKLCSVSQRMSGPEITPLYGYGSVQAKLFDVLVTDEHAKEVHLKEQDMIDLRAWCDLGAPFYDRSVLANSSLGPYGYTKEGQVVPPTTQATRLACTLPREVFANRCAACHADKDIARPNWIDTHDPARSLILQAPLAKAAGGEERCGKAIFAAAGDPDYQAMLAKLREAARAIWLKPDINHQALIEAGMKPAWVDKD